MHFKPSFNLAKKFPPLIDPAENEEVIQYAIDIWYSMVNARIYCRAMPLHY